MGGRVENLSDIRTFVHVAQSGGFAGAARLLGMTTSAVSKAVARLETGVGAKLLTRTTRSVALTVEGERFLDGARRLLEQADALSAEFTDSLDAPRGRLVITAPAVFGRVWLTERVLAFMCRHSEVEVELMFDDRQIDMASEGVDVAVRIGSLGDGANLVARKLFDDRIYTCAAPRYVEAHGLPATPDDLENHRGLHYRIRNTGRLFPFMFHVGGTVRRLTLAPMLVGNSVDALVQAAEAGVGIAQLPSFLAVEAIAAGRLVEVLADYRMENFPYSIVYLDRRLVPPRVRAFVDFLVAEPPRFRDIVT
ncbi:MAG: LysR family transcriptional regulator [Pseudomonadota bacterium]